MRALTVALLLITTSVSAHQDVLYNYKLGSSFGSYTITKKTFSDGYRDGYKTAHRQIHGYNRTPFVPSKPFKRYSDPKGDYEFGYVQGRESAIRGD